MTVRLQGTPLIAGASSGVSLTTSIPLSLWGGLDPTTGEIIDRHHPLSGHCLAGRTLVLPHGRGSCSASGVLLEAIRNGMAPAGIIVSQVDPILGLGAILGDELFKLVVPVVLVTPPERAEIPDQSPLTISIDGVISW